MYWWVYDRYFPIMLCERLYCEIRRSGKELWLDDQQYTSLIFMLKLHQLGETQGTEVCRIAYRAVRVHFRLQCHLPVAAPCSIWRQQWIWWKNSAGRRHPVFPLVTKTLYIVADYFPQAFIYFSRCIFTFPTTANFHSIYFRTENVLSGASRWSIHLSIYHKSVMTIIKKFLLRAFKGALTWRLSISWWIALHSRFKVQLYCPLQYVIIAPPPGLIYIYDEQ